MNCLVIELAGFPQFPENAQPAIGESAISPLFFMPTRNLLVEICLRPCGVSEAVSSPIGNSPAQQLGTFISKTDFVLPPTLDRHWNGASRCLERVEGWETLAIIAH